MDGMKLNENACSNAPNGPMRDLSPFTAVLLLGLVFVDFDFALEMTQFP